MSASNVFEAAINHWGEKTQGAMAMGECGELIAALNRYFVQNRENRDEVIEEIADVEIMLEQLKYMFGSEDVEQVKARKINRLYDIVCGNVDHQHKAP